MGVLMDSMTPGLAGQKGLRGDILLSLKRSQPATAKELAKIFGVSANAVRRHLKELEAERLVAYGREQRGTGAPTYAYRLSADGEGLFPNRYEEALTQLLEHVVAHEGRDVAASVLQKQYDDLRAQLGEGIDALDPVSRLRAVAGVMEQAGFMAEIAEVGDELRLTVHNCAIHAAATCLPEICETELQFVQDVMATSVERSEHIMSGCNTCQYVMKNGTPAAPAA